jgi:hypothetical protein
MLPDSHERPALDESEELFFDQSIPAHDQVGIEIVVRSGSDLPPTDNSLSLLELGS